MCRRVVRRVGGSSDVSACRPTCRNPSGGLGGLPDRADRGVKSADFPGLYVGIRVAMASLRNGGASGDGRELAGLMGG